MAQKFLLTQATYVAMDKSFMAIIVENYPKFILFAVKVCLTIYN